MKDKFEGIKNSIIQYLQSEKGIQLQEDQLIIRSNAKTEHGEYGLPIFGIAKQCNLAPNVLAEELVKAVKSDYVQDMIAVNGFLNFRMSNLFWHEILNDEIVNFNPLSKGKVLVEFCSPNTNKPLHLGHIRNILLGWSVSQILNKTGYDVIRTQVVNDRGIAICKSMVAWEQYGEGATPETSGMKGDHFVGKYYVLFETKFKEEYEDFQFTDMGISVYVAHKKAEQSIPDFFKAYKNEYFNRYSKLGKKAKEVLQLWEQNDNEVRALWRKMNDWVLSGFEKTFQSLNISFHENYFESDTYELGRDIILEGVKKGWFTQREDQSVWVDLTEQGMDEKLLLRSDGTSVYMTQDIGMARMRYNKYHFDKTIYVVADEQDYHFKALFETLAKIGEPYTKGLYHLNYGMVELPSGRMKSREGTVVDADDLIDEVIAEANKNSQERGELGEMKHEDQYEIIRKIGMAALKYHLIKVQPKKKMIFDPKESVDLQGHTGPYIQNAYVRIRSIIRKIEDVKTADFKSYEAVDQEKDLLVLLLAYKDRLEEAAEKYDPSVIANYAYELAKSYHRFYHDISILRAESEVAKAFRIHLSNRVAETLAESMLLLGIEMPEKM